MRHLLLWEASMRGLGKPIVAGLVMVALAAWPVAAWSADSGLHICVGGLNVVAPLDCPATPPPGSTSGGSAGQTTQQGQSSPPANQPASGPPPFSRSVDAKVVSGTVRVKRAGAKRYVVLSGVARLASGSLLDTTAGTVSLTSPRAQDGGSQSAAFSGATFKVVQRSQAKPTTDVNLAGGDFSRCRAAPRGLRVAGAARKRRKRVVRRVRGSGHGRFRTRGRYGSASVRGTIWVIEDRCDGMLVRVQRGAVSVRDFVRQRTVVVGAGNSYWIRARG